MISILFNLPSQPPSLIAGYDAFMLETAATLGYGDEPSLWTTLQNAELDRHVQEAYRYCLYPSRIPGGGIPHVWSWLRQIATITTVVGGADPIVNGTFDADSDWTKGTGWTIGSGVATGSTASGDLEQTVDPLVDGRTYTVVFTVAGVTAGGVRAVLGTRVGTTRSTNGTFTETIVANGAGFKFEDAGGNFTGTIDGISATRRGEEFYTLPADFGSMHSKYLTYPSETGFIPVERTSAQDIRERNQQSSQTNQPWLYATEWEPQTPGLSQRQRLFFYPTPDQAYTFSYSYAVIAGRLSKTNPYPLGGPRMSQVMVEACKAVGEAKKNGSRGDQWNIFREALGDAISLDASSNTERTVGLMRDPENDPPEYGEFSVVSTARSTYSGIV